jgi:hypothetical protein
MSNAYLRNPLIEAAPLQDETILLNPAKNQFCVLNRTASFIWNQLNPAVTINTLSTAICKSFSGVAMEVAQADADHVLEQLLSLTFAVSEAEDVGNPPHSQVSSSAPKASVSTGLPNYECPRLTLMNEEEVLSAFQVPVVATTWWG